ncbi:Interferon-induced, double-stranded RNA-activated protein kinase [Triplophysa tibetana]|uniref:non-specific serine/threonine protein kinase n=1 Tax=Triplophysa tibetana TaxID=1572043 RepID=A0A5A9P8S3_9TELE|nr:Interferon-induced, double-stranded RNA-activated protein kinase [Triplophysa tibetana]
MEAKILDLLSKNGKSTALRISKDLKVSRGEANKHLYGLEKSKQVKKDDGTPPIWDLMEATDDPRPVLKPDTVSVEKGNEIVPLEKVSEILRSGGKTGLKAHQIARDLGLTKKTVNKHLHSLRDKGELQKSENNKWIRNDTQDSEASVDSTVSDSMSSNFDVIKKLGEGGYGCVYKAQHKYDGKTYAVKKVELTEDADAEARALAKLEHPNIVRYITCWPSSQDWGSCPDTSDQSDSSIDVVFEGSCENDTSGMESLSISWKSESPAESSDPPNHSRKYLFIQMEFCEGGKLTTWIHERNYNKIQRTIREINQVFHEIVSGVEYVHAQNLIHRDLKPDNILFGAEGKVKIGDFGLAATLTNPSGAAIYRTKGRGTLDYMSPEQESSQSDYGAKTDIFPLGLIWFEMLWKFSTGMERAILWSDLRNQEFPEGFCDAHPTEHKFIRKMLSYEPGDRPSATEIKEKLDRFFSMNPILCQNTI